MEAIKWGAPTFTKDGRILIVMAAFKAHAAINFWNAKSLGLEAREGMGSLGKLASLDDLPDELDALIGEAAARAGSAAPKKARPAPRPVADPHPDFAAALAANPAAKAVFEGFAPSHRRDYVEWIADAKQEATRTRRIAQAVAWLAEGKRRNWRYENC